MSQAAELAQVADVLAEHAGIDYADDAYYCIGCLESLGMAIPGVERRWAEHVAEVVAGTLRARVHGAAETAINSVYGTDDRHSYMGLVIARKALDGTPLPWSYPPASTGGQNDA